MGMVECASRRAQVNCASGLERRRSHARSVPDIVETLRLSNAPVTSPALRPGALRRRADALQWPDSARIPLNGIPYGVINFFITRIRHTENDRWVDALTLGIQKPDV